jgi:6-pyruvoyltetrahydropterin/6-carboxytetrahydropterin synthase
MYVYHVKAKGSIGHHLADYDGKCKNPHGHTIEVEVDMECQSITRKDNMAIDFGEIKEIMEKVVPDHCDLNAKYNEDNPTAEFLAKVIFDEVTRRIENTHSGLYVQCITVWESEKAGVTYYG